MLVGLTPKEQMHIYLNYSSIYDPHQLCNKNFHLVEPCTVMCRVPTQPHLLKHTQILHRDGAHHHKTFRLVEDQ